MRENRVRRVWAENGTAYASWLMIDSQFVAEILASEDFDAIVVDLQHGMLDFNTAVGILQAISSRSPTPIARVPWNDPSAIMKLLDAGAYGIICPMINNRAECERFVAACRYPPNGIRSWGPIRGTPFGGGDYLGHANNSILTMAMIETREALNNLDAIMSVEGLDGVYVGPSDLSLSLGHPPSLDVTGNTEVSAAIADIVKASNRHQIKAGIHCASGASAADWSTKGFRFCTAGTDMRYLVQATRAELSVVRKK